MRKLTSVALLIAAAIVLAAAPPARAHHATNQFDMDKTITLTGTVKEFQWTNPHTWIQVLVTNADAGTDEWSAEMASPATLSRLGWKKDSLKQGDKVTVTLHPLKNGDKGGIVTSVLGPDGQPIVKQS
jgi:hypothetical protein